ncbi:MAG: phage holin family protein [Muribaculaceae bacterium]
MDISNYKELFGEIKKYVTLQVDYTKYTVVEKLVILLSASAVAIVVGVLGFAVIFYLSISLASYLAACLGCVWAADMIVAGIYALILVLVVVFRRQLIINPISRFLTKLFLKPNE